MPGAVLALGTGLLFGAFPVAVRVALRPGDHPPMVAAWTLAWAAAATGLAAVVAVAIEGPPGQLWPFALAGLVAPGASQVLLVLAIREIGPARSSVAVGTAPLIAVVGGLVFLGEPIRGMRLVGAALIVVGGVVLVREPDRPEHLRPIGLAYAAGTVLLFAGRDVLLRWLSTTGAPTVPIAAAAISLGVAALLAGGWGLGVGARPSLGSLRRLAVAGVTFGASYLFLFEALARADVSVVSPLVATESLWGVIFASLVIGKSEAVGPRLVLGASLVVSGAVLIGAAA